MFLIFVFVPPITVRHVVVIVFLLNLFTFPFIFGFLISFVVVIEITENLLFFYTCEFLGLNFYIIVAIFIAFRCYCYLLLLLLYLQQLQGMLLLVFFLIYILAFVGFAILKPVVVVI